MRRMVCPVSLLVALLIVPVAQGATTLRGDVSPRIKRYVRESLVSTPSVTITVRLDYCPVEGAWGCWDRSTGTLYVAFDNDRAGFLHELGHVFDDHMRPAVRWAFASFAALPPVPWFPDGQQDLGSTEVIPGERFADAYSLCARHRTIRRKDRSLGPDAWAPTPRQHAAACRLIQREAGRQGWATPPARPRTGARR